MKPFIINRYIYTQIMQCNCTMKQEFTSANTFSAIHSDGQYRSRIFQETLFKEIGSDEHKVDPFFFTSWDVSPWTDLAMKKIRTSECSSAFFKRLIARSNRFHTMFSHGNSHSEYKGLATSLGLGALETVTTKHLQQQNISSARHTSSGTRGHGIRTWTA